MPKGFTSKGGDAVASVDPIDDLSIIHQSDDSLMNLLSYAAVVTRKHAAAIAKKRYNKRGNIKDIEPRTVQEAIALVVAEALPKEKDREAAHDSLYYSRLNEKEHIEFTTAILTSFLSNGEVSLPSRHDNAISRAVMNNLRSQFPNINAFQNGNDDSISTESKISSSGSLFIQIPKAAPEIYLGLRGPETPPEFVKRVYEPWLGKGLTRGDIRKLDPKLYDAIDNWSRRNEWPADVDLPTVKEQNNRWAERIAKEGLGSALSNVEPNFALREAARLRGVMERRKQK